MIGEPVTSAAVTGAKHTQQGTLLSIRVRFPQNTVVETTVIPRPS